MNIKDSEQIRKILKEEYNKNCTEIDNLSYKIKILNLNNFEQKFATSFALSIIPWVAITFLLTSIAQIGILPIELVQPLSIGIPALIGACGTKLLYNKQNINKKIRKFSNAKSQKEKIEEEIRYELAKEKIKSHNKVIKLIHNNLLENENIISFISESYSVSPKEEDNRSKEEISINYQNTKQLLNEQNAKLDEATTKEFLSKKFWRYRNKFQRYTEPLMFGSLGSVLCMILYNYPLILISRSPNVQIHSSVLNTLMPAIIGGCGCIVFGINRKNKQMSIFKNINSELGNEALPETIGFDSENNYEKAKKKIINDTCSIKLKLESEKQKLNHISQFSNEENVMDSFLEKLNNDNLSCDKEPTNGKELEIDEKFIDEQLESYNKLLASPFLQEIEESSIKGPRLVKK